MCHDSVLDHVLEVVNGAHGGVVAGTGVGRSRIALLVVLAGGVEARTILHLEHSIVAYFGEDKDGSGLWQFSMQGLYWGANGLRSAMSVHQTQGLRARINALIVELEIKACCFETLFLK